MPEYETIRAAVAREKWAVEKVLECYSGEIDKLATVKRKQPDGSMKKQISAWLYEEYRRLWIEKELQPKTENAE